MFREDTALTTMFKVWSKVEAMPYLWHSFAQLVQEVRHIAAAKVNSHPFLLLLRSEEVVSLCACLTLSLSLYQRFQYDRTRT
jgi:hypothetical protein